MGKSTVARWPNVAPVPPARVQLRRSEERGNGRRASRGDVAPAVLSGFPLAHGKIRLLLGAAGAGGVALYGSPQTALEDRETV